MEQGQNAMDENPKTSPQEGNTAEPEPLPKGQPLTLEESIERMYERYNRTFEALAK